MWQMWVFDKIDVRNFESPFSESQILVYGGACTKIVNCIVCFNIGPRLAAAKNKKNCCMICYDESIQFFKSNLCMHLVMYEYRYTMRTTFVQTALSKLLQRCLSVCSFWSNCMASRPYGAYRHRAYVELSPKVNNYFIWIKTDMIPVLKNDRAWRYWWLLSSPKVL